MATAVTNQDQFNKGNAWLDTQQKVANHTTRQATPECTGPENPDMLSQGAHSQTSYPRVQ